MNRWSLGIDFGTSYTVVAVWRDDHIEIVDVESDGRARIASAVFVNEDNEILVGSKAQYQAVFAPERFEPNPKRTIGHGEVFLGDGFVSVSDLIGGVLHRVYAEACRQQGETVPQAVTVTHPADWADARISILRSATEAAGLRNVTLIPEPVAAAARIASSTTKPGDFIAVYDFGGGTFDAAVLRRTENAFEVAGPPAGRDPLGGEDIDRRIIEHVGTLVSGEHLEQWQMLMSPPDVQWRRSASMLRSEVQKAKETLSEVMACQLWVDGINKAVQLTRPELDEMIGPDIDLTVDTLEQVIEAANLEPKDLQGIYLVGGSSRIPLVADTIWRRTGVRPAVQENPKSVVAMGAAVWGVAAPASPAPASTPATAPVVGAAPAADLSAKSTVLPPATSAAPFPVLAPPASEAAPVARSESSPAPIATPATAPVVGAAPVPAPTPVAPLVVQVHAAPASSFQQAPARPGHRPQSVAVPLVVLLGAAALIGLFALLDAFGLPATSQIGAGTFSLAGNPRPATGTTIDLSGVPLQVNDPSIGADHARLLLQLLGNTVYDSGPLALSGSSVTFVPGRRYFIGGGLTAQVQLMKGSQVVGSYTFPVKTKDNGMLSLGGVALFILLLFSGSYGEAIFRRLRRGERTRSASLGMGVMGGLLALALSGVVWLALGKVPSIPVLIVNVVLGAVAGEVAVAMTSRSTSQAVSGP